MRAPGPAKPLAPLPLPLLATTSRMRSLGPSPRHRGRNRPELHSSSSPQRRHPLGSSRCSLPTVFWRRQTPISPRPRSVHLSRPLCHALPSPPPKLSIPSSTPLRSPLQVRRRQQLHRRTPASLCRSDLRPYGKHLLPPPSWSCPTVTPFWLATLTPTNLRLLLQLLPRQSPRW